MDVKVSDQICKSPQQAAIDMSCLKIDMPCNDGIVNLMPENIYQTINGTGDGANNVTFNLDQVNNMVSNGYVSGVSNGDCAEVSCLSGGNTVGIGNSYIRAATGMEKSGVPTVTAQLSPSHSTTPVRLTRSARASCSAPTSS